jgi:branched-chain amino acid transport system substrate-binding protein
VAKFIKDTPTLAPQAPFLIAQDDEFGVDGVNGFKLAGHKFAAAPTLYPQGGLSAALAEGALTKLSAVPGKPVLVLFGTTDTTATILKAAEKLSLVSKFTWIAGSRCIILPRCKGCYRSICKGIYEDQYQVQQGRHI